MPEELGNTLMQRAAESSNPFVFWLDFFWELTLLNAQIDRMDREEAVQKVLEFNAKFGLLESSSPQEEN